MSKITYFEKPGIANTAETLKIAKGYAEKKGIRSVVVASTRGFTAEKAGEIFQRIQPCSGNARIEFPRTKLSGIFL